MSSASLPPFLEGEVCLLVGCRNKEKLKIIESVVAYFGGQLQYGRWPDSKRAIVLCSGRPRSCPDELLALLVSEPAPGTCIVSETWLYASLRAQKPLDSEAFSCIHLVPGPARGGFSRRFEGNSAMQAQSRTKYRLPELPQPYTVSGVAASGAGEASGAAADKQSLASYALTAQHAARSPLYACVVAVAGFTETTSPSRSQVLAALLGAGACVLSVAYTDVLTHLLVYVPCPAVAIGSDGLVSHQLPATQDSSACVALSNTDTLGTLVPIARADEAGAPPQHPQALAEAEAAERWYRDLTMLNADAPHFYALTPLPSTKGAAEQEVDLDAPQQSPVAGLGALEVADASSAAQGIVAQSGSQPLQSLKSTSGFVVETVAGRVATPAVSAEAQAPPLDAPKWIWRKSMSGCARAYLASASGAAVVTAEWLARSLQAGRPLAAGAGVLSEPGSCKPLPCLHRIVTADDVMQEADKINMERPHGSDEFFFLLSALRRANGCKHPAAPWLQGADVLPSSRQQDATEAPRVFAMTTGYKAAAHDVALQATGCASAEPISHADATAGLAQWGNVVVLDGAQDLAAPVQGRAKHAFDQRCRMLIVWGLGRVEKLCAVLARGGWVLWPTVRSLKARGRAAASPGSSHPVQHQLSAHEVCLASCSSRCFGRVFAGAPRAWRLHGRPAFQGWLFVMLQSSAPASKQGPPLDMLHRILVAGGASVLLHRQGDELQLPAHAASGVPGTAAQESSAAAAAAAATETWPHGRVLQPHQVLLLETSEAAFSDFARDALQAMRAAGGALPIVSATRGWPLDYLTQEDLPAFIEPKSAT